MRRRLFFLSMVILFTGFYSGCKRGEEDPFLSFLSRKQRICGKWHVVEARVAYGDPDLYETDNFKDKGKLYIQLNPGSIDGNYSWTFEIKRDGTYNISKSMFVPYNQSFSSREQGYWYFLSRNKKADIKNKECVAFQPLTLTIDAIAYEFQTADPVVYDIVQLKNKKIKLQGNRKYKKTDGSTVTNQVIDETISLDHDD